MKKTSLMQKMHSLFSSKAWRNGMALLVLLCFVGTTQMSAQASFSVLVPEGEFVTTTVALKRLQIKKVEFDTTVKVELLSDAEYAKWKFYSYVGKDLQSGETVEDAIENADSKLTQKAIQTALFTAADVNAITEEVSDYLRNN